MKTSLYIAYATVISELASVVQSICALYGFNFNYASLIIFSAAVVPCFKYIEINRLAFVIGILAVLLAKPLFIGLGPEAPKGLVLTLFALSLILLGPKVFFSDFLVVVKNLRWVILGLGLFYLASWFQLALYRNASTYTLSIMTFFAFGTPLKFVSLLFFAYAKTLYQFTASVALVGYFITNSTLRTIAVSAAIIGATVTPIILAVYLSPDTIIISPSHTASLQERLNEVRAWLANVASDPFMLVWGDKLGWVLEAEYISPRGYLHATHLWLIRSFGIFGWLIGVYVLIKSCIKGNRQIFALRLMILASHTFLLTMFTSPFLTVLLLCNAEPKRSNS